MKKIIRLCLVATFVFGFLFSSLGQNPANAAGWLTPEWYAKYYGQKDTNPQPAPDPAPTPEPTPQPEPNPTPAPNPANGNYWTNPSYY
ncbi:MAG: hypothetical protein GXW85_03355, partial [Clostridia bacterium]|nr:hypothetical protein [Clostridia bacterium]